MVLHVPRWCSGRADLNDNEDLHAECNLDGCNPSRVGGMSESLGDQRHEVRRAQLQDVSHASVDTRHLGE